MEYEHLIYTEDDQSARITLNRPDRLNAFLIQTWNEFRHALHTADDDDGCRAIVISGEGRAFSSGDDIADLDFENSSQAVIREYTELITESIFTIEEISTPVIAKVDGIAVGGGCELAALCDVTVASQTSTFRQPEPLLGNIAGIALSRFPDLIGLKRTRELLLTARELEAEEAFHIGLVNEVVPDDELDGTIEERIDQISKTAPLASKLMKEHLNEPLDNGLDGLNVNTFLFGTDDMQEGVSAFFDERSPEWSGK